MTQSPYPIVNDYVALLAKAALTKDTVRAKRMRERADRMLESMTAAAARDAMRRVSQ